MSSGVSPLSSVLIWVYNVLFFCIPTFAILGLGLIGLAFIARSSAKRGRRLKVGGALLIAAALIPVVQYALWHGVLRRTLEVDFMIRNEKRRESELAESSILRLGDDVPAIDSFLENAIQGREKPQVIVVNFFATWCGPCLEELPHLQRLADKYKERKDVLFVVVGRQETQETLDKFLSDNPFHMQFIADVKGEFYSTFATKLIPRTYLIDSNRKIRFEVAGFNPAALDQLEQTIDQLVK
jgi:thiol-disulfide isomerase/thioredoxin